MKILQINTVYNTGSTGKITAAIEELSNNKGYESYVGYGRGIIDDNQYHMRIGNKLDFYNHVLFNFCIGRNGFASKAVTQRFLNWLDIIQPDIIHLHNIHGFYIHVGLLFNYIKKNSIPVVWTFHDCWSITGQCAYFDCINCQKWREQCHDCPIYRSDYPYSIFKDNSIENMQLKKEAFLGVPNMTIITPSRWLRDIVKDSFLKDYPVKVINNGINLDVFHPYESTDTDRIILGVANAWDKRKGLEYLLELSNDFNPSNGYRVVIVGLSHSQQKKIRRLYSDRGVIAITRTANQIELAHWYSRAYVYVNSTLQDNFPTTNLEALACGTPVITFNTGGSPESVAHGCGYVVSKGDYNLLRDAIHKLSDNEHINAERCLDESRKYDEKICFEQYIQLYESIAGIEEDAITNS